MARTLMPPAAEQAAITVTNPVTGEPAGRVPRCTPADVIAAVGRARAAQPAWAAQPFRARAAVAIRFHDLLLDRRDEMMDVLQSESGKSRRDAFVELFAVANEARYYAYHGGRALRPERVRPAIPLRERAVVVRHPVGVVGVLAAWNFPLVLAAGDTLPALLAGNGVVVKPASLTPLTALWFADAIREAGLPDGLLQIVTGPGSVLGDALIDHVDYLMFTGSTAVGRRVAERAASNLIPFSMELGGKNALLVLPDANLPHAARVAIEGAFNNAGQVCINYERAYVHEAVYDAFTAELVRQVEGLRLGATRGYDTDTGSLSGEGQLDAVEAHVADAVGKGATVLAGGQTRLHLGPYFYAPTVLAGVTPEMDVYAEETFGPVLSVYRVGSVEEAVAQANDSRYGLYFGVATRDRARGRQVAEQLAAGTVAVNDSYIGWAVMDAPLGGMKESGIGRRHGPEGIRKYTEAQTIVANRTPWQIGTRESALAMNERLARTLVALLRLWRRIPFLR